MRIDRGAGCGAAPRRLPGRRSRPPPSLRVSPPAHPTVRGTPDSPSPTTPPHARTPSLPVRPPLGWRSPAPGVVPAGVSGVGSPEPPRDPRGDPRPAPGSAVPRGAEGLGFAPGAAPGALCEGGRCPKFPPAGRETFLGVLEKKAAHMHSSRHSPAHRFPAPGRDARVSAAHLPQPETDIFFFSGPGVPGACWAPQHLPTPRCPGRRDKNQPCRVTAVPPRWSRARSLSHTAPLISGRRSRGGCPGAQQRPGSLGGGFSLRAGSSCCVPHGWLFPGTPSPRRI